MYSLVSSSSVTFVYLEDLSDGQTVFIFDLEQCNHEILTCLYPHHNIHFRGVFFLERGADGYMGHPYDRVLNVLPTSWCAMWIIQIIIESNCSDYWVLVMIYCCHIIINSETRGKYSFLCFDIWLHVFTTGLEMMPWYSIKSPLFLFGMTVAPFSSGMTVGKWLFIFLLKRKYKSIMYSPVSSSNRAFINLDNLIYLYWMWMFLKSLLPSFSWRSMCLLGK